jgi:hypothetical protein
MEKGKIFGPIVFESKSLSVLDKNPLQLLCRVELG